MTTVQNIRLVIEYEGTRYNGWQLQRQQPTVQGALLDALEQLVRERPTLQVAGRTDAGVHAIGQVVSFATESRLAPERFAPGLNRFLPDDIRIHESRRAEPDFDARHHSLSKEYQYVVHVARNPAALLRHCAWHVRPPLDVSAMRQASRHLVGKLDFQSFRSVHCDADHAHRHMYSVTIDEAPRLPSGTLVTIRFHANAYCRHMCRILAGTLVEVGQSRRSAESVAATLAARDRTVAGMTAPAAGLTLLRVHYPE